eukprot:403354453
MNYHETSPLYGQSLSDLTTPLVAKKGFIHQGSHPNCQYGYSGMNQNYAKTGGVGKYATFNDSEYFQVQQHQIMIITFAIFLTFYQYDYFINLLLDLFQTVAVDPLTSFYYIWLIYFFSIIFLLPTVYLTIGVGWAYKRLYDNFFSFLLSRYVFRTQFTEFISKRYPNYQAYNQAIKKEGCRFVFFMQFSLIPYSLLCYLFGLTQVSLMQFAIGILGMLLPNLFWAYVGSLLQNISEITGDSDPENSDSMATKVERFTFMCLGFAIAIYGLYKVSQSAKESVRQQMNMNESSTHGRSYDEMNEFEINHENPEEDIVDRDFSLVAATLAYSREIRSNTQQRKREGSGSDFQNEEKSRFKQRNSETSLQQNQKYRSRDDFSVDRNRSSQF